MITHDKLTTDELRESMQTAVQVINMIPGINAELCEQVNNGSIFVAIRDEKGRTCYSEYMKGNDR